MSTPTTALECPLCGSTRLEVRHDHSVTYRYLKKDHVLDGQEHTVCLDCDISFCAAEQLARNRELFDAFERQIVKDIAPREVRELREKYLITQEEATRIFNCGSPTAFSKWERGDTAPTGPTALLLRLALEDVATMQKLAARAGVEIDVPAAKASVSKPITSSPPNFYFDYREFSALLEESVSGTKKYSAPHVTLAADELWVAARRGGLEPHYSIDKALSTADDTLEAIPDAWMYKRSSAGYTI